MQRGIVRKIDALGRVVIPAETKKMLGLENGDPIEICIEEGNIILKPYHQSDEIVDLAIRMKDRLKNDGYSDKTIAACMDKIGDIVEIVEDDRHE